MTEGDLVTSERPPAAAAAALGLVGAAFLIVGWASDHRYASLLFAIAPLVAVAGLIFTAAVLRRGRDTPATVLALSGGGASFVVLVLYVYALLAYGGGGN